MAEAGNQLAASDRLNMSLRRPALPGRFAQIPNIGRALSATPVEKCWKVNVID